MAKLTDPQYTMLAAAAKECLGSVCEGGCNLGWSECKGGALRVARRLESMGMIVMANGARRGSIAIHITQRGRFALNSTSNRRGAGLCP